jgi:hypothetical protein
MKSDVLVASDVKYLSQISPKHINLHAQSKSPKNVRKNGDSRIGYNTHLRSMKVYFF